MRAPAFKQRQVPKERAAIQSAGMVAQIGKN